jgi:uncharacterized surface protein with fasciclin (FAS1) repeats
VVIPRRRNGGSKKESLMIRNRLITGTFAALTLFALLAGTALAGGNYGHGKKADIVDTAVAAGSFNTLVTAIQTAGLVETLKGDGPFTVFAPTDEAFAKLPEGTVESLLQDKEKLAAILKYHVVSGKVMAKDVVKLQSVDTVSGKSVKVDTAGGVKINNANVVKTDIVASNGIIHVIDTVLIPG